MTLEIAGLDDLQEIGRGGFGIVYRAREAALARDVAVKVLAVADVDPEVLRRFEREAQVLGRLSEHPHIVTVYATGRTADGRPWVSMAYLPNGSLGDRLRSSGPLDPAHVAEVGIHVAGALETAHRHGVLHRDVKPENILQTSYGAPALADFGIARMIGGTQTTAGSVTASLTHAAPETLSGASPAVAADVYALASTLYALANGRPAFDPGLDGTLPQLLGAVMHGEVPDLTDVGVPAPLAAVVAVGMAKNHGDRPSSAAELGRLLADAQGQAGWARTAIVVLSPDEVAPARPTPASGPTDDATRIHARSGPSSPTADAPQPGASEHRSDAAGPVGTSAQEAPATPAQVESTAEDTVAPDRPGAAAGGRRRPGLLVSAGAVAAVAIGIGFAVAVSGGDTPTTNALTPVFIDGDSSGPGRVVFRTEIDETFVGAETDGWQLYVATAGQVQVLSAQDGLTRWTVTRAVPSAGPLDLGLSEGVLWYADGDDAIGRDVTTGGEVARVRVDGLPTVPFVTRERAVLATAGNVLAGVGPRGEELWRVERPLAPGESWALHDHLLGQPIVVTTDAELLGIDATTGEVRFAQAIPERPRHLVAQGGGVVVVATAVDEQLALQAHDARNGQALWDVMLDAVEEEAAQLAIEDGVLVVADGSTLAGFDPTTGAAQWRIGVGSDVLVSTGSGRVVAMAYDDGGPTVTSRYVYTGEAVCGPTPIGAFPEFPFELDGRWHWVGTDGTIVAMDMAPDLEGSTPAGDCVASWVYDLPLDANARVDLLNDPDLGQLYVFDDNGWVTAIRTWDL